MRICEKTVLFGLLFFLLLPLAQSQDYDSTVIMNPSISRRCKFADKERKDKLRHKQKLMELITRNRVLVKKTPPHKQSVLRKLRANFARLRHELRLTLIKISRQEEDIVRKGCPGINF